MAEHLCVLCLEKAHPVKKAAISVPVVVVPILNWPVPFYLQFRGGLCYEHTMAFDLNKFTDYFGAWYDLAGDTLRSAAKPAVNPFLDNPNFKWESWIIDPKWEPAPKDQCEIKFWKPSCLDAKGASATLW